MYIYKTGRIELYEQIKRHSHFIKGRVLDVGCGTYSRYKHLFKFDEYVKMDIEQREGVNLVGKVESIPSPDNSFDSIVCTQVLGDVYEIQKAFGELYRVLRPDGILLVTESLFDPLHDAPHDYWRFTEHSLRRLSEDAGFKVEVLEKRGGYWSIMAQLKARYWLEVLRPKNKMFSKLVSWTLKIDGTLSRVIDRMDKSSATKSFTHGYILIARKHA